MLKAISPLDGRYHNKLQELGNYFSEFALFQYRVKVEILYFIELSTIDSLPIKLNEEQVRLLKLIYEKFTIEDAQHIQSIERTTKHDIKAVEYFIKEKIEALGLGQYKEYIHFALTSQDINNTAIPLLLKDATSNELIPILKELITKIKEIGTQSIGLSMLARTHGQPASPTTLGKEILVFVERLELQFQTLEHCTYSGKFGGATGNFNAHHAAYPQISWPQWADNFLKNKLGINRQQTTTQIAHYDELAVWFHQLIRINTILLDFCKDIWMYISMEYFKQIPVEGEIGSSAMPHKVNPIDFENAEGNLGISSALCSHFAEKLPISRLQRDLTDSTVLRNIGIPFGHTFLAIKSMLSGLKKLDVNQSKIDDELNHHWIVLAEPIQTILRRESFPNPYEALKHLTRGNSSITKDVLHQFIDTLEINDSIKQELKSLTPQNYIGYANKKS